MSGAPSIHAHAVVALGSNLGDSATWLQAGLDGLRKTPGIVVTAVSGVYLTSPVGTPPDSPAFHNAVALLDTGLTPERLLARCLQIEAENGRRRPVGVIGAARTLDLDVIAYRTTRADGVEEDVEISTPRLRLPHPRAADRRFVLEPWLEIDPDAVLPAGRVAELVARLTARAVGQPAAEAETVTRLPVALTLS